MGIREQPYEQRKYAVTVASLPRPRYHSAYEPDAPSECSRSCWPPAVISCSRVTSSLPPYGVPSPGSEGIRTCGSRSVPFPTSGHRDPFDLVVLSEMRTTSTWPTWVPLLHVSWDPRTASPCRGCSLAWRDELPPHRDRTHEIIAETPGLLTVVHHSEEEFVLDIWERR